jgi:hypothetical protein
MTLHAIAWTSTAARGLTDADLDFIVAESHRLNEAAGITGVLLYCDGNFMQYLEGAPEAVVEAFARIHASRRHHEVNELLNQPVAQREFTRWTTGCSDGHGIEPPGEDADGCRAGPGHQLLRTFWRNCRTCTRPGA